MRPSLNMEQAFYPTSMSSVQQTGPRLAQEPLSYPYDLNTAQFQDLLSSSIDLESLATTCQDAGLPFEGLDAIEEVENCEELPALPESLSFERTQQFIEEMDIFIKQQEDDFPMDPPVSLSALESSSTPPVMEEEDESATMDEETKEALQMLDDLIQEKKINKSLKMQSRSELRTISLSDLTPESISQDLWPSLDPFFTLNESSSSTSCISSPSPSSSSFGTEFSPSSSTATSPRREEGSLKPYSRSNGCGRPKLVIKDKKERKRWQNVEAARRYRDKKTSE
eukprot:TRINITY_DN426_c0_g1_i5.p1 TRINITY_DN426_c0_g1~~TRINITY_DN426_c0_g1_i5.p1  ORF type:complete len:282 (+),score=56.80 TRINITY_DN426_c0_g1_i5:308-1153(+)